MTMTDINEFIESKMIAAGRENKSKSYHNGYAEALIDISAGIPLPDILHNDERCEWCQGYKDAYRDSDREENK